MSELYIYTYTLIIPGIAQCIPKKWRCDGKSDCQFDEDEKHCENNEGKLMQGYKETTINERLILKKAVKIFFRISVKQAYSFNLFKLRRLYQ